ncbi:MAG: 4-hydroxy-tetrahydrodipicolinate synthase [Verrucomicrobiota bacterium]
MQAARASVRLFRSIGIGMIPPPLEGTLTALVTPFAGDAVDYAALRRLVQRQIDAGINGLVPTGTTGESPTLSVKEHLEVIRVVVETAAGRVPVIAGTGANSTAEAIELSREAINLGVDGCLQVAPYYNKPSQEGIYRHFAAIAEVCPKIQVLYSIPGRCGVEIGIPTVARLADAFPHVRTIKEAGGTVTRVQELRAACGDAITILSGDDGLNLPFIAAGARGTISVASNLAPRLIGRMIRLALDGDLAGATRLGEAYRPVLTDLQTLEGNPVTIKTTLAAAGVLAPFQVRLPLCELSPANRERVQALLAQLDLSEDVA